MVHWRQARGKTRGEARHEMAHIAGMPFHHRSSSSSSLIFFPPLSMWRIIPRAAARPARPVQLQLATASTWWRHFHVFNTPGDCDGDRPAQIKTNRSPRSRLEDKITIAAFWGEAACFLLESQRDSTSSILQFFYFVGKKKKINLATTAYYTMWGMEGQTKPTWSDSWLPLWSEAKVNVTEGGKKRKNKNKKQNSDPD